MMKLDRNVNKDGKGKYALVRLRTIEPGSEASVWLRNLDRAGVIDWGCVGQPDEFFVIKLRDKYADAGLRGYSEAVMKDCSTAGISEARYGSLFEYALQVQEMESRAGTLSDFCKEPD